MRAGLLAWHRRAGETGVRQQQLQIAQKRQCPTIKGDDSSSLEHRLAPQFGAPWVSPGSAALLDNLIVLLVLANTARYWRSVRFKAPRWMISKR